MGSCAFERFNNCTLKRHTILNSCVVHYYPRFCNINTLVYSMIVPLIVVVQLNPVICTVFLYKYIYIFINCFTFANANITFGY